MTWTEIDAACRGYELRLARSRELDRFIAAILMNVNRKKGTKAIAPEDIMPLLTDQKKPVELATKDEYEKIKEMFSKVKWQIQN